MKKCVKCVLSQAGYKRKVLMRGYKWANLPARVQVGQAGAKLLRAEDLEQEYISALPFCILHTLTQRESKGTSAKVVFVLLIKGAQA
jgi:hypothetical protein